MLVDIKRLLIYNIDGSFLPSIFFLEVNMKNKLKKTKFLIIAITIITILFSTTISNKETIVNTINTIFKTEGNEDNRVLYGSVVGIDEEDYDKAIIILYNSVNSYTKQLNENFEFNFTDITDGDYYLKIEIEGYQIPSPESIKITNGETINKDITINTYSTSNNIPK